MSNPQSQSSQQQLKVLVFQCCCLCFYLHILVSKIFFFFPWTYKNILKLKGPGLRSCNFYLLSQRNDRRQDCGAGGDVQSVKCLLGKSQDLSSIPNTFVKLSAEETERDTVITEVCWPVSLAESASSRISETQKMRPWLKKTGTVELWHLYTH